MHERLRGYALVAWEAVQIGQLNPLLEQICQDEEFLRYVAEPQLRAMMEAGQYLGNAPQRALALAETIRQATGDI
jgi:adenylosuccinate lyase